MGRPPIGKVAMTGAERVARHRAKHAADKPVTKETKPDTGPLEARIRELEAKLAQRDAELAKVRAAAEAKMEQPATKPATTAELEAQRDAALAEQRNLRKMLDDGNIVFAEAKAILEAKAIFPAEIYKTLRDSAHPDRTTNPKLKVQYQKAFQFLKEHERMLAKKPPRPLPPGRPRTMEEFVAAKWRAKEEAKAKRAATRAAKKNPPKKLR